MIHQKTVFYFVGEEEEEEEEEGVLFSLRSAPPPFPSDRIEAFYVMIGGKFWKTTK